MKTFDLSTSQAEGTRNEKNHFVSPLVLRSLSLFFVWIFLVFSNPSYSQKQGNIWYFGNLAGLSFNSGSPVALTNGQLAYALPAVGETEGSSVICDSSGALLFYSNGATIWNKIHQVMQNGSGILGHPSSTQSSIIVPDPANPDEYFYLFTTAAGNGYPSSFPNGMRYSKIDICLDSSKGAVMTNFKNIKLLDTVCENLAVCRHANGFDYWIVTHKFYSNRFVAFLLTASGITNTIVTNIGSVHNGMTQNTMGQMKISPNGQKLAIASTYGNLSDLFDFNNSTGVVSNWMSLVRPTSVNPYGFEFSADNSKLYSKGANGFSNYTYQYDLSSGNVASINASMYLVAVETPLSIFAGLQIGPNNKIYTPATGQNTFLSVINNPNLPGVACNYSSAAVSLSGRPASYSLPSIIAGYSYSNKLTSCCLVNQFSLSASSNSVCAGNTVTLTGAGVNTYTWSNSLGNNPSVVIAPGSTGIYAVSCADAGTCIATRSIAINVLPLPVIVISSPNQSLCVGGTTTLTSSGGLSYTWQPGGTQGNTYQVIPILFPTVFSVTGTGTNNCTNSSTFTVGVFSPPVLTVTGNTVCAGGQMTLTASGAISYTWLPLGAFNPILFWPTVSTVFTLTGLGINNCTSTINVPIIVVDSPTLTVTGNTVICKGEELSLTTSGANTYTWNTGLVSPNLLVTLNFNTNYTVTGSNGCGSGTTAISVIVDPCLGIPSFAQPNKFKLFPNPACDEIVIESSRSGLIRIINSIGENILEQNLREGENMISVSELSSGIYCIHFIKDQEIYSAKLIIEH